MVNNMDNLGKEFLDFLATAHLKEARSELYNLLDASDDEVNVYYFTPLSNLKRIVADGGIKCRAMVGSDVNYLRLDIFRDSLQLAGELAWSAYWLASITHHTKWSKNTFMDLKNEIVKSLKASVKNDILDQDKRQIANKMLRHLSVD